MNSVPDFSLSFGGDGFRDHSSNPSCNYSLHGTEFAVNEHITVTAGRARDVAMYDIEERERKRAITCTTSDRKLDMVSTLSTRTVLEFSRLKWLWSQSCHGLMVMVIVLDREGQVIVCPEQRQGNVESADEICKMTHNRLLFMTCSDIIVHSFIVRLFLLLFSQSARRLHSSSSMLL